MAAYVPAEKKWPAVVALVADPRRDPGRPIKAMLPSAIKYVRDNIDDSPDLVTWTMIEASGNFMLVVPKWNGGAPSPTTEFRRFPTGIGIEAFLKETGATGEVALEMLSSVIETPSQDDNTPSAKEFLDAIDAHGNLPVPSTLFHMVEEAVRNGDVQKVGKIIQSDPVISASLINYANAARFAAGERTASVPQAVVRLGVSFVQRVVFIATMMTRYQKGRCREFDYLGYWKNSLATGAAMRAVQSEFSIPPAMSDDVFAIGLVSGIGWLAVAETFPAIMTKYLQRCRGRDPLPKIRLQKEVFPCPIRMVSDRYLQRFAFPEVVHSTVAGKNDGPQRLGECLARATRIAQTLVPLNCLAVLPMAQVPPSCVAEWERWQGLLKTAPR